MFELVSKSIDNEMERESGGGGGGFEMVGFEERSK